MGYQRNNWQVPPVQGCSHAYGMDYTMLDRCWCNYCGQTWKWRNDERGGWFPLPLREVSHGQRL